MKAKKWIEKNLIPFWAICSVIVAIIIHIAFSIEAQAEWMEAKWGAGEILTYFSTIALGLLALWQNKRFKEENDISQQRLESLSKKTNELASINQIIAIESANLLRLNSAVDTFRKVCDEHSIAIACLDGYHSQNQSDELLKKTAILEDEIDASFFGLCRELRIDYNVKYNDTHPLKRSLFILYREAKEILEIIQNDNNCDFKNNENRMYTAKIEFLKESEHYIAQQEKKLYSVIYGNQSLDDIKKLYRQQEDTTNGQAKI